jgi:membrane-associated protease RseP (regulator of RpoE activity)
MSELSGSDRPNLRYVPGALEHGIDVYVPLEDCPELTARDLERPRRRRLFSPLVLFLATCVSTFAAGATNWSPDLLMAGGPQAGILLMQEWRRGLAYMAAVIGILLTHEMGHFLQAVRYRIPSSLPFFIPVPIAFTGTMGAVIGMEGSRADRKQLFDIGISGPLAGLVVAIPIIVYGVLHAPVNLVHSGDFVVERLNDPLIFRLLARWLRPDLPADAVLHKAPLLMAGWVGMLITGLNMMPVSQLDGGHVIYGLFGKRAHLVARGFVCASVAMMLIFENYNWVVMFVVVLMIGVDHPATRDDTVRLGPLRTILGWLSLLIPFFCFTPVPVMM